jgi:nitrogen regulatory protein PII
MKLCKRIEIVIESAMVPSLLVTLKKLDVPGYTYIPDVRGSGDRGVRRGDELTGDSSNSFFLIACDDEAKVEAIKEAVRILIARSGGICLLSDAQWLRH